MDEDERDEGTEVQRHEGPDDKPLCAFVPASFCSLIAWLVIVAAVVAVALPRQWQYREMAEARSQGTELPADRLGVELAGRIAVGSNALMQRAGGGGRGMTDVKLSPEMEKAYPLRMAILAGELSGQVEALKALDRQWTGERAEDAALLRTLYEKGSDALTAAQQAHLKSQYGWFGELALTHGLPSGDSARQQALHPAILAAMAVAALLLIGVPALLAGIVLLILAIVFFAQGILRPHYSRRGRWTAGFLEGFAIYLGGMGLILEALRHYWPAQTRFVQAALYFLLPLAAFWPLVRGVTWRELRQGLGWHRGRGVFREIGAGIVGYLTVLPLMGIGLIVSAALAKVSGQSSTHPIVEQAGGTGLHLVLLYLLACVWAPIAEETMFRGALYAHMRQRAGWAASALVVAFIFAIIHPQGWVALPVLGTFAFASASIREWRSSLIGCMTAHAINNGVAITLLVMMLR